MKLKEFDYNDMKQIRAQLEVVLKPLEDEHGITFDIGSMARTRAGDHFHCTLNVDIGTGVDKEKRAFEKSCSMYGFRPEDYNMEVRLGGKEYKLFGFNNNAPKWCIEVRDSHGKEMLFQEKSIAKYKTKETGVLKEGPVPKA
tara:strand:- start:4222 stop:4647 length:426 start_codon:yes stop_codon:yes gene_type:complete